MNKSGVRQAGEVTLLVGAILDTISQAAIILFSFLIWAPIGGALIALLWVARDKALKGSKGWMIYGIVQGALTGWVTMAGHILMLVDYNQIENKVNHRVDFKVEDKKDDEYYR
ncbi:MAG: hypothetical protein RSA01_00225 [Clostridium sp.]